MFTLLSWDRTQFDFVDYWVSIPLRRCSTSQRRLVDFGYHDNWSQLIKIDSDPVT